MTFAQGYIGYIRVSTTRQGTEGVSLQEQRDAISRYAEHNRLPINVWLEETETAAKRGRPVFNQALRSLRKGDAKGIILHKLDRGARNLKDWADIGELADQGVEVHFVNESLDLHSRGGRLSADIQAVVAADYIRNLREETRKGFYGRLKQGLYPLRAPLGYADQGGCNAKTIDPIMGPLVRKTFQLYATARYSMETLGEEVHRLGLRNANGGRVTRNGLSTILNNPFYIGLIRIRKTGENFTGIHEPLVGKAVFDRVQAVLGGRVNARTQSHVFQFRRMLSCAVCGYSLIGEQQKGHVYYRCHGNQCHGTSVREDSVENEVRKLLQRIRFTDEEKKCLQHIVVELRKTWTNERDEEGKNLDLQLSQIKHRLTRLTDAVLDGLIDKTTFEERKKSLIHQEKTVKENLTQLDQCSQRQSGGLEQFLELASNAWLSYEWASPEEKRELVNILTSNRTAHGKKVDLRPSIPFEDIVNRFQNEDCSPYRYIPRTFEHIIKNLYRLEILGKLPDLGAVMGCARRDGAGTKKYSFMRKQKKEG